MNDALTITAPPGTYDVKLVVSCPKCSTKAGAPPVRKVEVLLDVDDVRYMLEDLRTDGKGSLVFLDGEPWQRAIQALRECLEAEADGERSRLP